MKPHELHNVVIGWTDKFPRHTFTFREPERGRLLLVAVKNEEKPLIEETVFRRKVPALEVFAPEQRRLGILPFK